MSSPFLPEKSEFKEEPLAQLFELDENYQSTKKSQLEATLAKTHPKYSFSERLNQFFSGYRLVFSASFATSIIIAGLIGAYLFGQVKTGNITRIFTGLDVNAAEIDIQPDKQTKLGVDPNTKFTITTKKIVDEQDLKNSLSVLPAVNFDLKKTSDNTFSLQTAEALNPNEVYKFNLKTRPNDSEDFVNQDLKWAFQVQDKFKILSTLPKDKATNVSLDSGIEVTLNSSDFDSFENSFEISPKIGGKVEKHDNVLSFAPSAKLDPEQIYTVKIKPGISLSDKSSSLTQDYSFQFETGARTTQSFLNIGKSFVEVVPNSVVSLQVLSDSKKTKLDVTIYAFKDQNQLNSALTNFTSGVEDWSQFSQNKNYYDVAGMNKFNSGSVNVLKGPNDQRYFNLPKTLPAGIYIIEAVLDGNKAQMIIQSTSIAGYVDQSTNQTLVWLQDLDTKQPIAKANVISLLDNRNTQTDETGIALFDSPATAQQYFYVASSGDRKLYIPVVKGGIEGGNFSTEGVSNSDSYWSHLYSDRSIYKPTDTIKFWGFIQNRASGTLPKTATAQIIDGSYSQGDSNHTVLGQKTLILDSGTFNDQIDFRNLQDNNYTLVIKDENGKVIHVTGFTIKNYVKPVYNINLISDKKAYFAGEKMGISGSVNFYEGSPVVDTDINFSGLDKPQAIKTDQNGNFATSYQIPKTDSSYTTPNVNFISATPKFAEEYDISSSITPKVFNYHTNANITTDNDGAKGKIQLQLNEIDISKLNDGTSKNEYDYLGKEIANKSVKLRIEEYKYVQREDGEYYDFINKKVQKSYQYDESYVTGTDYNNIKSNDKGLVSFEFDTKPDSFYKAYFEIEDTDKSIIRISQNIYNIQRYSYDYYTIKTPEDKVYSVGDTVDVKIARSSNPNLPGINSANFLFTTYQQGLKSFKAQNKPTLSFNFEDKFVPNVYVAGVYFDGKNFYRTDNQLIQFKKEDRKLNIQLQTDKKIYEPQDTVNLTAKVTDKDGNPVNTKINFSVVDEALMTLYNNQSTPLDDLYVPVNSGELYSYQSHESPALIPPGTGGKGDGGGDNFRKDFPDTVFFKTLQTNDNGDVSTSFKVPDSLTSWRITADSVSKNLFAGSNILNITVKKPFFATAVLNQTYLEGDQPKIKLRAFGSSLNQTDNVEFSLSSSDLKIPSATFTSKGSLPAEIDLGTLSAGSHNIIFTATNGNFRDSVERSFEVLPNYALKSNSKYYKFDSATKIEGSPDKNTTITFANDSTGKYYKTLVDLSAVYGDRIDQKLTRNIANTLLKQDYNLDTVSDTQSYASYQTSDGGIAIYPYSDNDLESTIWAIQTTQDKFDIENEKGYLNSIVDNPSETRYRKIQALFGLSSLDNKVLSRVLSTSQLPDLSSTEKLYIGLALTNLNDYQNARKIYSELTSKFQSDQKLNTGKDANEINYNTILVSILGLNLEEKTAFDFFDYSLSNQPNDKLVYLPQVYFIQKALANINIAKNVEFKYTVDAVSETRKLSKNEILQLQLSPTQLKSLKVEIISGNLGVTSSYLSPLSNSDSSKNNSLTLSRQYLVNGNETSEFDDGTLVQVVLFFDIKDKTQPSCYNLTDYLPSGLIPASDSSPTNKSILPNNIDGQKVSFCATIDTPSPISYYAKALNKGQFRADSATIQSVTNPELIALTKPQDVKVK